MNKASIEFNKQLELDILVNGLTEVTQDYVNKFDRYYGLTDVIIPEGVKSIGDNAFFDCSSLTSVTIPNSVKSIGDSAFEDCSRLIRLAIPAGVTSIGYWAFESCCGLTSVTIPKNVTSIGNGAFYNCSGLTSVTFEGKTLDEVRSMKYYPWGILDPEKISVQVSEDLL